MRECDTFWPIFSTSSAAALKEHGFSHDLVPHCEANGRLLQPPLRARLGPVREAHQDREPSGGFCGGASAGLCGCLLELLGPLGRAQTRPVWDWHILPTLTPEINRRNVCKYTWNVLGRKERRLESYTPTNLLYRSGPTNCFDPTSDRISYLWMFGNSISYTAGP